MDYKETKAPLSTITYDKNEIEAPTENIYEAISIIAKRANQINSDIKNELVEKLEEFAIYNDSLEEVFENKEQIEFLSFMKDYQNQRQWLLRNGCKVKYTTEHQKQSNVCLKRKENSFRNYCGNCSI